jgi:hypothetical protein
MSAFGKYLYLGDFKLRKSAASGKCAAIDFD